MGAIHIGQLEGMCLSFEVHVFSAVLISMFHQSLGSGRPPIFRLHEVDCKYPEDPEAITGKDGETLHSCECAPLTLPRMSPSLLIQPPRFPLETRLCEAGYCHRRNEALYCQANEIFGDRGAGSESPRVSGVLI